MWLFVATGFSMTVVSVTSDKKYAKLYEDIVFTITYDTELTAREKEAEWSVYVGTKYEGIEQ